MSVEVVDIEQVKQMVQDGWRLTTTTEVQEEGHLREETVQKMADYE